MTDVFKELKVLEQSKIDELIAKDPLELKKGEFGALLGLLRKKRTAQAVKAASPKARRKDKPKGDVPDLQALQASLNLKIG